MGRPCSEGPRASRGLRVRGVVSALARRSHGLFAGARMTITGHVIAVRGSVVDIAFSEGVLPAVADALELEWSGPGRLVVEVQQHLDPRTVRTVALQSTAGLQRGISARSLGGPIRVPVGDAVLGLGPAILEWPDEQAFFNVNVPEDLLHAASLLNARR
jgi:F-type H+-transporting ATPase subunit beta